MDPIAQIFGRLDTWRHLPSYQLERRADIFFSVYMREVLETNLGYQIRDEFVPEFPVRIGSIDPSKSSNESFKIDYLLLSADGTQPIFVELKTDNRSRRDEQDQYLLDAQQVGLGCLLDGLIDVFEATSAKRKYYHLFVQLERMGLLELPRHFCRIMESTNLRGATETARAISTFGDRCQPPIVRYVQPLAEEEGAISFAEFANIVGRHDDPVSRNFAQSLQEWAEVTAGNWTQVTGSRG